jgi:hypothetical protein
MPCHSSADRKLKETWRRKLGVRVNLTATEEEIGG